MANKLEIKVTSPTKPGVKDVKGGTINIAGTAPNWILSSSDDITTFLMDTNKVDITKIEIVTEALTSLRTTFYACTALREFVVYADSCFSGVTDLHETWARCPILSFPMINTSSVTTLQNTWFSCDKLTSFPKLDTSNVLLFNGAWGGCSALTSFPVIDTSKGTNFQRSWGDCYALTDFPELNMANATRLYGTWINCKNLKTFPSIDFASATNFEETWRSCTKLKCIGAINTTLATTTKWMFRGTDVLCRPNAAEQAQITATPGINWISDVPAGEDCCTWKPKVPAKVGINDVVKCYVGVNKVGTAFLGALAVCKKVP